MPVRGSKVVQGIGLPFSIVADKFIKMCVIPELKLQSPVSAGALDHLPFVGIPLVEGSGQTHALSVAIFDREAYEPTSIIQRSGTEMFWCSLSSVGGDCRNGHIRRPSSVTELDVLVESTNHEG